MAETTDQTQKAAAEPTNLPDIQHLSASKDNDTTSSVNSIRSSGRSTPATEQTQPPSPEQTGPIRVPFAHPLPSCKPEPKQPLSAQQTTQYNNVLSAVKEWTSFPKTTAKNAETEPLSDDERMWLSKECLLRYLRATTWNTANALTRIQQTLVWRREYGVDRLTADHISPEMETGKECILGYDNHGRVCLHLDPGRQNTKKSDRQIEGLVFMLERALDFLPPGQETLALLIRFKNATSSGSPSVGQGRQTLSILQGHYPERLGRAFISDLPWYINTFFKLISPFIDPVTKTKMIFNTPLKVTHVPAAQLWKDYGGDADFDYDHQKYWPVMNEMCQQRRAAAKQRWVEGGKRIGELEAYLRGGDQKPLKDVEGETPAE